MSQFEKFMIRAFKVKTPYDRHEVMIHCAMSLATISALMAFIALWRSL